MCAAPDDEAMGAGAAGTSRARTLALLRARGVPAVQAVRIWAGVPGEDVGDALSLLGGVALPVSIQEDGEDHTGMYGSDGDSDEEQDEEDGGDNVSRMVAQVQRRMLASPGVHLCVRHEPGNGRLGLLLRRCPPLLVKVHVGAQGENA